MTNIIAIIFLFLALLVFLLGLFSVAIPNPVLLGLALLTAALITERLSGYIVRQP
jgi:putative effector of murein hydrolase LrgA (UPF0299 family)